VVEEQPAGHGPRVITKPVPLVLEEGQTATFECQLSAVPAPEVGVIQWYILALCSYIFWNVNKLILFLFNDPRIPDRFIY